MANLLAVSLAVLMVWILAYRRSGPVAWSLSAGLGLGALSLSGLLSGLPALLLWALTLAAALLYLAPDRRRRWISAPLLERFRALVPPMSSTEREALEAGSVWWEGELFSGRPDWQRLMSVPAPTLSPEEQAFLDGPVEALCQLLDDWRITHEDLDLPPEIWRSFTRERLFGMIIPRQYGGLEFSAQAHSAVVMKLASRSITAAVSVMVPNSLGPAELLLRYGTQVQRDHYLPRLARGEEVPCFALTGPRSGSDAGAMPDRGVVCRGEFDGEIRLGIRLNWNKRYITLAPVATLLGLAFKLYDPEHLLGEREALGITLALIPTSTPGVEIGRRHFPSNIPFQNGPTSGRDVFIPLDWIIGGRKQVGQGWRMLMECLAEGRGVSLPALATAAAKLAARHSGTYAAVRRQFNQPIGRFEGVEEALARIAGNAYRMDAARRLTLSALDLGERPAVISAIVKYQLTESYRQVINDAMDIQGGSGICLGPSNPIGRVYQAIPIAITVEGANILTRNMIVFGQGAIRCHPYLRAELAALREPDPDLALASFDRALFGHLGFIGTNLARSLWLGLTRGRFSASPLDGPERRYFQQVNRLSAAFALAADLSLLSLGPSLKRRERLSARLGDLLSQLYLLSATLKHYADGGSQTAELPLLRWACEDSLARCREAMLGLLRNLPLRPLAWLLRLAVFPSGPGYRGPDDRADHLAARLLQAPSAVRDRLSAGIFASRDPDNPVGRLELALEASQAAEPLERRLRAARRGGRIEAGGTEAQITQALPLGLLTPDEAEILLRSEALREQVIQVDSFDDLGARSRRPIGAHWRQRLRVITGRVRGSDLAQSLAPAPSNQETRP